METPSTRRDRAARTRQRILDAAFDAFAARGYHGTTIASVAEVAGVAEQTIYFSFGNKATLLYEVMVARRGDPSGPTTVMEMPWVAEAIREPDQARTLALIVEHGTGIFARLAPIAGAMDAARLTDPAIASHLDAITGQRQSGMATMIAALAAKGPLAVSDAEATDVLAVVQSIGTYSAFVDGRGWSTEAYQAWCYRTLTQLLPPLPPAQAEARDLAATRDTGFHACIVRSSTPQIGDRTGRSR